MSYIDACPKCENESYIVEDYGDEFDQYSATQWYECRCPKCGYRFIMSREYKLTNVSFEEVSAS